MLRTLLFIVQLTVVVLVAVWLANWGGSVDIAVPAVDQDLGFARLAWESHEIHTTIGLLLLAAIVFGVAMVVLYRLWFSLRRAPGQLGSMVESNRQKRGYRALTQGMVAVAAGEVDEARKWARKADELLNEPPLTRLLAAQAAQLDGDEAAAKRYFTQMLQREDTRFLGLRGLLTQALREGDEAAARGFVRQAYAMRPKTPWVLSTLFDLTEKAGELEAADKALKEAARLKVRPVETARRQRSVLLVERAQAARTAGDLTAALGFVREARKLEPGLVPATVLQAELQIAHGRRRDAARLLERAWQLSPHPELVTAYRATQTSNDPIERFKGLGKLTAGRPADRESALALGEAALEASLWGEARRHLGHAAEPAPDERMCRLMARLVDAEHGDMAKAREWLLKASDAPAAPSWVCSGCGTAAGHWTARCEACAAFDGLAWRTPPRVAHADLLPAGAAPTPASAVLPPPGGNGAVQGAKA